MDRGNLSLLPAVLIARRLGVSKQLVYSWTRSGKLASTGTGADGRALYAVTDALNVDRATRRSPNSHRLAA